MYKKIIQIGSHIGYTPNDPIFNIIDDTTNLILVEPVPFLFEILKNNYKAKYGNNKTLTALNMLSDNYHRGLVYGEILYT